MLFFNFVHKFLVKCYYCGYKQCILYNIVWKTTYAVNYIHDFCLDGHEEEMRRITEQSKAAERTYADQKCHAKQM